jgi:hypothetical protein
MIELDRSIFLQVLSLTEKLHEEVGTLATSKANKSDVVDLKRSQSLGSTLHARRHPFFPFISKHAAGRWCLPNPAILNCLVANHRLRIVEGMKEGMSSMQSDVESTKKMVSLSLEGIDSKIAGKADVSEVS